MYINITDKVAGSSNQSSSGELVHYLEKENRVAAKHQLEKEPERWFTNGHINIQPHEVRQRIDGNVAKLLKTDAKFFLVNISPSQKELKHLAEKYGIQGREAQLKVYTEKVMDEYARNFKRPGINSSKDLVWFGKLEHYRYYTYKDKEVKQGLKKRGERKEGEQLHIQVIVSRKDATNKIKLSPQNKSRGKNEAHSKKVGQFDRVAFKESGEKLFDQLFAFDRGLKESFQYANTQKHGTLAEKQALQKASEQHIHRPEPTPVVTAKDLLAALLMPTRDEQGASPIQRKRRRRKGLDEELSL